jgi:hypothetical protein
MVGEIDRRFNLALANCGEAIGTVAAQSIGEPTTQVRAARAGTPPSRNWAAALVSAETAAALLPRHPRRAAALDPAS